MSADKRKRSPNWLPSEKELLLGLVQSHFNIIENKKTDGVTVKTKLAQWQIIADQYNSRTTHCSRTGENLKAQWESMKKVARKDAANIRQHRIQTGGGSPLPPKKEDPFLERVLSLISTSATGLFNPFDSDSIVPAVQDQAAIPITQTNDFPEPPPIQYKYILVPPTLIVDGQMSDTEVIIDTQESVTKDWGDYTPKLLRTPVSLALKIDNNEEKSINTNKKRSWISRRRPTHTSTSSSLEQLHKKKIEAIELQSTHGVEEMERSKALHDLDIKIKERSKALLDLDIEIKKEKLKQEKIQNNLVIDKAKKAIGFKKKQMTGPVLPASIGFQRFSSGRWFTAWEACYATFSGARSPL